MSLKFTPKFLFAGLALASVIVFGTMYAVAQNGPSADVIFSDEVLLEGTVIAVDDHGFIMVADSETYNISVPKSYDFAELGIAVGSEVTVSGYIAECPNDNSEYTKIYASSINGIAIDHDMQTQTQTKSKSGEQKGTRSGSSSEKGNGPEYSYQNC